jgi:hypothetical protein
MFYLGRSVRLYLQLFVGGLMFYLGRSGRLYLQLFVGCLIKLYVLLTFSCVFFVLFVFVLCLVYPMLTVSLDCPFIDCSFGVL